MKLIIILAIAAVAYGAINDVDSSYLEGPTVYGYIQKHAIPLGNIIREEEEKTSREGRVAGGTTSTLGQIPYQAGILATYSNVFGTGICGGSLVSNNRVLTSAHCWFDGQNQASYFTVVLGSVTIFTGGTRLISFQVINHPNFNPITAINDVAVVYLPLSVTFSSTIAPVSLPVGDEQTDEYVDETVLASGFGLTQDGASISGSLSHVNLTVISNAECAFFFPNNIQPSNICTSGRDGMSTCRGDSGGPLVHTFFNRVILVGIPSFSAGLGCQLGFPAASARVGSFMDFFSQHL